MTYRRRTVGIMATLVPPASAPVAPSIGRTQSGGFKTTDGTLYVSQPFRSKTSKKMRALITFAPRKSHFDTTNESSGANEFRVSPHVLIDETLSPDTLIGLLLAVLDLHVSLRAEDIHCEL